MAFHATTRWGADESEPQAVRLREILDQLDAVGPEHPCVSLTHESEWCLSAFTSGLLVWENVEVGDPRYMKNVTLDRVLELWIRLSKGFIAEIETEPWMPGDGDPSRT